MIELTNKWVIAVVQEYNRALEKHPKPYNSKHEAFSILQEEVDELWDAVKGDMGWDELEQECVQVAAVALRFLNEVIDHKKLRN